MVDSNGQVNGLRIPTKSSFFYTDQQKQITEFVDYKRTKGLNTNILLRGPQGSGKSTLPEQYAATRQLPYVVLECGMLGEASMLFGQNVIQENSIVFREGIFPKAITTPNCVIHLQELNRPESDRSLNAMFSVLDPKQRSVWIDEAGKFFDVAPGVTFFASLNEGYEFVGTMPLDSALEDRFQVKLTMDYLPDSIMENLIIMRFALPLDKVKSLIAITEAVRVNVQEDIQISTRNVLDMAEMMVAGIDLIDAIKASVAVTNDRLEGILQAMHFSGQEVSLGDWEEQWSLMS